MRPTSTRSSRRILTTWREVTANPAVVAELRAKYKLLPDLPAAQVTEIGRYFEELAKGKSLPAQWRRRRGGQGRLRVLHPFRPAHGEPASLKVEDFWDYPPARSRPCQTRHEVRRPG